MVEKAKVPVKIILSYDRKEALKDADFVITQLRVGLLDARIKDERISLKHGIIGQETNGAGGMFKALRTIPVILEIVKEIQEICPDAWLINFTNPAGMVTEAVLRYTDFKRVIGLCNVPISMVNDFAELLNVDAKRISMEIQGVNHHIFATDVFLDGASVFDLVLNRYITQMKNKKTVKNVSEWIYSEDLIKGLRAIPCPYLNYYFFTKEHLLEEKEEYQQGQVRGEVVEKVEKELFCLYENEHLNVKPKQLEERGGAHYSQAACNLIQSIYSNRCDIQYVNVRNNGAISNLPKESAVEIACIITKDGPKPIAVGEIMPQLNGNIQMIKTFERLVCKAAVEGDRASAITALNINPLCPSDSIANLVFDELFEAHKAYLTNFIKNC
jgi:6-phospho-beta-glucosidase